MFSNSFKTTDKTDFAKICIRAGKRDNCNIHEGYQMTSKQMGEFLEWVDKETARRTQLFAQQNVSTIEEYNKKCDDELDYELLLLDISNTYTNTLDTEVRRRYLLTVTRLIESSFALGMVSVNYLYKGSMVSRGTRASLAEITALFSSL